MPRTLDELVECVRAGARGLAVCGSRHAMGGQQFARDTVLVDMTGLDRVLSFDPRRGLIRVEAGIDWPALMAAYLGLQRGRGRTWGFAQKQTGADHLSLGGSVSANAHGRGLAMPPLVGQVESLEIVDARGTVVECSRTTNAGLFRLVVGGYGLFGVIYSVTLRLTPRIKLCREAAIGMIEDAPARLEGAGARGALYGDFQFAIDPEDREGFLRRGVVSCYEPVASGARLDPRRDDLSRREWLRLLRLACTDPSRAFDRYAAHYLDTQGQVYWSDEHQLSTYLPEYPELLRKHLELRHPESLVIGELFVPRDALARFMGAARVVLRTTGARVVYGTVRLVEPDTETFLPWSRGTWAGVIFNLRTEHTPAGIARTGAAFRGLIDAAIEQGGSYYLTYHRYATREQVLACHPRMPEFLELKRGFDPGEVFRSDWYMHHRRLLGK